MMKTNFDKKKISQIVDELVTVNKGIDTKFYQAEKRFFTARTLDFVGMWNLSGKEMIDAIQFIEEYIDKKAGK